METNKNNPLPHDLSALGTQERRAVIEKLHDALDDFGKKEKVNFCPCCKHFFGNGQYIKDGYYLGWWNNECSESKDCTNHRVFLLVSEHICNPEDFLAISRSDRSKRFQAKFGKSHASLDVANKEMTSLWNQMDEEKQRAIMEMISIISKK